MKTRISRSFKDISLSFNMHPVTKDISVLKDANAIKRSVRNLVQTIPRERFFNSNLGSDVRSSLFDFVDFGTASVIQQQIETTIDNYENILPKIAKFIIPGGNENSSLCHIARCVCRRAERLCVKLGKAHQLKLIIQYLNRLSDCLFVFARHVNMINDGKEIYWEPEN